MGKYLDKTGLQYFYGKLKEKFADKTTIENKLDSLTGALTWKGKFDTLPAVTDYEAGNVIGVGNKEYVLTVTGSTKAWEELGDEGSYLLKSVAEETYLKKAAGEISTTNIADGAVISTKLATGARKPIILTIDTTEVDEETYQKLLSDDVDVMFKTSTENANLCTLTFKYDNGDTLGFTFTCFSRESGTLSETYLYGYEVYITKTGNPHPCEVIDNSGEMQFDSMLLNEGFIRSYDLKPVLKEIDLSGTDADRKAKLDKFEADWKELTGSNTLEGARFIGKLDVNRMLVGCILAYNSRGYFDGISLFNEENYQNFRVSIYTETGALTITPLFSHLEAITLKTSNTTEAMNANKAAIQAYVNNLNMLGVDTTKGFNVPVRTDNNFYGCLTSEYIGGSGYYLSGSIFSVGGENYVKDIYFSLSGYYSELVNIQNDNELYTTSKDLIGAINEVNTLAKNKQDKLTSGTNIKTINNQSLLGSGNIEISAPSITVDTSMSNTSTNPVQNKVIKAYIDGLVGNDTA